MNSKMLIIFAMVSIFICCNTSDDSDDNDPVIVISPSKVLVLDNFDPDYDNPPYDDKLTIMSSDGQVETVISGFNICQWVAGLRRLAVSEDGLSFIICQDVIDRNDQLSKYDIQGNLLWTVDGNATSACFYDDFIYVRGMFLDYGDGNRFIWKFDASGNPMISGRTNHLDIVADPVNQTVWTVGYSICKHAPNLNILFEIDPIEWYALSVDVNVDGSAWVAEGACSTSGENRMLKISLDGEIIQTIELESKPYCVRVDRSNGDFWVAGIFGIKKFNSLGQEVLSMNCGSALTLEIDPYDSSVWVGCFADVRHYSGSGEEMGIYTDGFSTNDHKFIGIAVSN